MASISIRGIDEKALAQLRQKAAQEGTSLNALAVRVLESQSGIRVPKKTLRTYDDLDALAGTWSAADAKAFATAVAPFEEIDATLWKSRK